MGCHLSKGADSPVPRVFVVDGDENEGKKKKKADYRAELTSYEAACRGDPDLQSFDTNLHIKMKRALSSFSDGVEVCSLSLDSLKEVTGCLLEMNQEVAKLILDCKKDIWNTPDLFRFVEDYFDNSLQTLHFCTALNRCLKRARDPILLIQLSLHQFHEDSNYARALECLREFKQAAGNPFTQDFFSEFQAVYRQQLSVLENLQLRKRKLDKKLKSVDAWRKVSFMIFAATFASVLICSVVAAAVAAPPLAAALAAASSIPLGSMGKWFDSLIKKFEDALKGQKEIISSMQAGTFVAINDLDHIRVMVDSLEIQICSLLQFAEFALKDEEEECIKVGVQGIQSKMQDFIKGIDDLGQQADRCSNDIRKARTILLQRIIRYPKDLTTL